MPASPHSEGSAPLAEAVLCTLLQTLRAPNIALTAEELEVGIACLRAHLPMPFKLARRSRLAGSAAFDGRAALWRRRAMLRRLNSTKRRSLGRQR